MTVKASEKGSTAVSLKVPLQLEKQHRTQSGHVIKKIEWLCHCVMVTWLKKKNWSPKKPKKSKETQWKQTVVNFVFLFFIPLLLASSSIGNFPDPAQYYLKHFVNFYVELVLGSIKTEKEFFLPAEQYPPVTQPAKLFFHKNNFGPYSPKWRWFPILKT